MSDHAMQSDHDGDGMGRPSMHLYQSIWMSHWTQTSYNSNQGHNPLPLHFEDKEDHSDIRQHRPQMPPNISKSAKGFGEASESGTFNIMNENLKPRSIKCGKERLERLFFPNFGLPQNRESIMALKNVTTCQGIVSEMGTSSGECHFQDEGILENLEQHVNTNESHVKKSLGFSPSSNHDVGSSSKIVPYGYKSGKSPMQSFICRQEEINQSSPVEASKDHLTATKFQSYSTSLVHDKKTIDLLDFMRTGTSSLRQKNMPNLLHDLSASNNQLPVLVGKQREKMQNLSGTRLFPNWSGPSDANNSETAVHDFYSVPRISNSLHDVGTMRICTTLDSMKELSGAHPKFSQTTHHFMITKETDVDLPEGGETFRDSTFSTNIKGKMFSNFINLSPGFGLHGQQGVKLQPLESSSDSEERDKFGDVMTSAFSLKNESSAETDTMDMAVFQKNHCSVVVSSPTNKIIERAQATSQPVIAPPREETGGRLPNIELPDINQELPALPAVASSVNHGETSSSRTQSLDAEHLLSHAELPTNSKSGPYPDAHVGSDPTSRWVKRLKLTASDSFAYGTKSSKTEEASSHEKVKKFVSKIVRCNITGSEPTMEKCSVKEPMVLDQTAGLRRNGESSSTESVRKTQDVTLLNPWIRRWCHHRAASPKQNHEAMVLCEPQCSNATLDKLRKKQLPSIAAMALMGKALNSFQPCKFRRTGSYVIWNT